jgi:hypothetical protein
MSLHHVGVLGGVVMSMGSGFSSPFAPVSWLVTGIRNISECVSLIVACFSSLRIGLTVRLSSTKLLSMALFSLIVHNVVSMVSSYGNLDSASAMLSGPFLYFHWKLKGAKKSCHLPCLAVSGLFVVEKMYLDYGLSTG